jgi:6,7-dimethyl-8-ribityllumazine synthase
MSRFNELVTERLLAGARHCLLSHGAAESDIDVVSVPGAWELPLAANFAIRSGGYAAVVALGCVIRGDTPHFDYVAGAAANGLARVSLDASIPVSLAVLTTDTPEQALARAGGKAGNKGWDAAMAAIEMASLAERMTDASA